MKAILLAYFVAAVSMSAAAETMNAPIIRPGDAWIYKSTTEKGASGTVTAYRCSGGKNPSHLVASRDEMRRVLYFLLHGGGAPRP